MKLYSYSRNQVQEGPLCHADCYRIFYKSSKTIYKRLYNEMYILFSYEMESNEKVSRDIDGNHFKTIFN